MPILWKDLNMKFRTGGGHSGPDNCGPQKDEKRIPAEQQPADLTNPDGIDFSGKNIPHILPQQPRQTPAPAAHQSSIPEDLAIDPDILYSACLGCVVDMKHLVKLGKPGVYAQLSSLSGRIWEGLATDSKPFLSLCANQDNVYSWEAHCVNVAMLAMLFAMNKGLARKDAEFVGVAAFLHDIGTVSFPELMASTVLTESQRHKIHEQAVEGAKLVARFTDVPEPAKTRLAETLSQIYEKFNGSGYPMKLSGSKIGLEAQLVAIADVYDAMTHDRPWRKAMNPHTALKQMIALADKEFSHDMVRLLISSLTIYPLGSVVALSTGEKGRVIAVNTSQITRPAVEILQDAKNQPVKPYVVDLASATLVHIVSDARL